MKIDQKLKKEREIYIRKNSKKILRGYFDGKMVKEFKQKMYLDRKSKRTIEAYGNSVKEFYNNENKPFFALP